MQQFTSLPYATCYFVIGTAGKKMCGEKEQLEFQSSHANIHFQIKAVFFHSFFLHATTAKLFELFKKCSLKKDALAYSHTQ